LAVLGAIVEVSMNVHPSNEGSNVGKPLRIKSTTVSLAFPFGRLMMTKFGLVSAKDAKSFDAVVESQIPSMVSKCLKKLDTFVSFKSYTVNRIGLTSALDFARFSAIRRPILPRPTNATLISEDADDDDSFRSLQLLDVFTNLGFT
jgi:hypothetical protein